LHFHIFGWNTLPSPNVIAATMTVTSGTFSLRAFADYYDPKEQTTTKSIAQDGRSRMPNLNCSVWTNAQNKKNRPVE